MIRRLTITAKRQGLKASKAMLRFLGSLELQTKRSA